MRPEINEGSFKPRYLRELLNLTVTFVFLCAAQNKTSFHFQYVIGRGGFGKVWKVELRKQKKLFAMKEMAKARIISKRSVNSVMNEKKFLSQLNHPFLVNMHYAF